QGRRPQVVVTEVVQARVAHRDQRTAELVVLGDRAARGVLLVQAARGDVLGRGAADGEGDQLAVAVVAESRRDTADRHRALAAFEVVGVGRGGAELGAAGRRTACVVAVG